MKSVSKSSVFILLVMLLLIGLSSFFFFRIDLTSDKRYSISYQTKNLMKSVQSPLQVTIYLTGDLNSGFLRLKKSTKEMLEELNAYTNGKINIRYKNPSESVSDKNPEQQYLELEKRGITATSVYDKDKEGKSIQKILFPWAELSYKGKTIPVNLLKNDPTLSGEENLNISIENLEFELTDAIRRLTNTTVEKIAFLEGHGELSEMETYDASKSLSRYFQIDRGAIGTNKNMLDDYKTVIIAKPTEPFNEKDKFVLDQYLMRGGTLLWLVDGVKISEQALAQLGQTPAMPYDLNLNDMLFRYGVRINPTLVQDVQSTLIPVNVAPKGQQPQFQPMPWVFSPLLLTSTNHVITKNLPPVKAQFASSIDLVGNDKAINKSLLLASSGRTHLLQTPADISLSNLPDIRDKNYYNIAYVPVGVSLEGTFQSVFANRITPPEIINPASIKKSSVPTRQIIIADGDIIRNDIQHSGDSVKALPLGLDRYTNQQFGNKDLIVNSILYLTDKKGWMKLRSRTIPLRLLNKDITTSKRTTWQIINVVLPLILLILIGIIYIRIRKIKYSR
ncbi:MAG: gliding motility-associated ABC transporter substrate-binding protein GldG [Paludibacteraceae bacterium]